MNDLEIFKQKHTDYFKQQAKKLLKDYKTRYYNEEKGCYEYKPCFFKDMNRIAIRQHLDKYDKFTLMNAQHVIAKEALFDDWSDLINSSARDLGYKKLVFLNRDKSLTYIVKKFDSEYWKYPEEENKSKFQVFKYTYLKKNINNKNIDKLSLVFDFSDNSFAQDMLVKIMKGKNLPAEKAISSVITQKNCLKILDLNYNKYSLENMEYNTRKGNKEKLENLKGEVKLNDAKEDLIRMIIQKEDTDLNTALLLFMLSALEELDYSV